MESLGEDLTKRDNAFVIPSMVPESRYIQVSINDSVRGKITSDLANEGRHVDVRTNLRFEVPYEERGARLAR